MLQKGHTELCRKHAAIETASCQPLFFIRDSPDRVTLDERDSVTQPSCHMVAAGHFPLSVHLVFECCTLQQTPSPTTHGAEKARDWT